MDTNQAGTVVYAGDNDGELSAYDPRTEEPVVQPFHAHERKVNTLHVSPALNHPWKRRTRVCV